MTADEEIAGVKECITRLFNVPVGSRWQSVFYSHMIAEVMGVTDGVNGENISLRGTYAGMADQYWNTNIVDFLGAYRRVS